MGNVVKKVPPKAVNLFGGAENDSLVLLVFTIVSFFLQTSIKARSDLH